MALTCRNIEHLRDAYLDSDLPGSLMAEVDAHLLQCPECQRQLELLRVCGNVIARDHSEPPASPDLATRVLSALPRRPAAAPGNTVLLTRRQRRRIVLERVAASAIPAIAALIAVAVLAWPGKSSPRATPREPVRLIAGELQSAPVDVLGVRALLNPTLSTLSNTGRVAENLQEVYRLTLNDARQQFAAPPATAARPSNFSGALMMEMLHPLLSVMPPSDEGAPTSEPADDIVRF